METVKIIHVAFVALSFAGFVIRGIWMLRDSTLLRQRWVRITPQVVDTVLLLSAIVLAVQLRYSPMEQPWLMVKISVLVIYIAVGLVALRLGRSKRVRLSAWLLRSFIFMYLVSFAMSTSALAWLSIL